MSFFDDVGRSSGIAFSGTWLAAAVFAAYILHSMQFLLQALQLQVTANDGTPVA